MINMDFKIIKRHNFNTVQFLNPKGEVVKKMILTNGEIDNLERAIKEYRGSETR